jgi:hypothetical protein
MPHPQGERARRLFVAIGVGVVIALAGGALLYRKPAAAPQLPAVSDGQPEPLQPLGDENKAQLLQGSSATTSASSSASLSNQDRERLLQQESTQQKDAQLTQEQKAQLLQGSH